MSLEIRPYLQWQSKLAPRQLFSQPPAPQYPVHYQGQLYFLEQLPAEGGRCVLVRQQDDGSRERLTPDGFNLRSRAHEYGGRPFSIAAGYAWFSNDSDHRIYRQLLPDSSSRNVSAPQALSEPDEQLMAIDFQLSTDGQYLIYVQERAIREGENESILACLPLAEQLPAQPYTLVSGADFYANPVLSADGKNIGWVEWNHPQMPWDGSRLKTASFIEVDAEAAVESLLSLDPESIQTRAGGTECSVCQLNYAKDGRLYFALDGIDTERGLQADYWSLFSLNDEGLIKRITHGKGEFGEAHWIFGQQRYVVLDENIIAIKTDEGSDTLVEVDIASSQVSDISNETATSISTLSLSEAGEVFYTAASFVQATGIHAYAADTGEVSYKSSANKLVETSDISIPVHLTYLTGNGMTSRAWYYPPNNSDFQAPPNDLPPLLVMVHGGPTSRCDSALNYQRQYWTSRGFAVLDVNHRGSTGYGRAYRQSLQGEWGMFDTDDVANAVNYCVEQKLAHPQQVCIRGGSAGGYVVLRALTLYPDLFCAGACYYGIGNLVTLMEFTHKFEARYLDGLLGAPYLGELSDRAGTPYYDRSPIHDLDKLKSPMIVFQGLEDKVVPPELSRELVSSLQSRGIHHEYVEYEGEGHGFRGLETRVDALEKEAAFFFQVVSAQRRSLAETKLTTKR